MKNIKLNGKNESGFTLVELAIVMIIIGLLIGGILKGQQLIANAEISATVSEVKGVDSAISTFREAYAALPGDMSNVAARVPNCSNACARDGNANGSIGDGPGAAHATLANENGAAWAQLAAADMLSNIISTNATTVVTGLTNSIPDASSGGQIQLGFTQTGALTSSVIVNTTGGHFLLIDNSGPALAAPGTASLSQSEAARLDRKLDDGAPNTGSVRAMGAGAAATAANCASTATVTGAYNEAFGSVVCGLYIRIQS
ncbi:MAG: prepilin-type N-terminal cleavage/methylation domain-containing protein [Alphaproteobacteria bacterium]|nr:prepilin-type N-terminal cleavage/methylation domain-containing protein [Alphaproteobacteria bacterium]